MRQPAVGYAPNVTKGSGPVAGKAQIFQHVNSRGQIILLPIAFSVIFELHVLGPFQGLWRTHQDFVVEAFNIYAEKINQWWAFIRFQILLNKTIESVLNNAFAVWIGLKATLAILNTPTLYSYFVFDVRKKNGPIFYRMYTISCVSSFNSMKQVTYTLSGKTI